MQFEHGFRISRAAFLHLADLIAEHIDESVERVLEEDLGRFLRTEARLDAEAQPVEEVDDFAEGVRILLLAKHDCRDLVADHTGERGTGVPLVPGLAFTIEPMINLGGPEVVVLDDGWTVVTADGALSAQFEHTVLVTESGVEVLTRP